MQPLNLPLTSARCVGIYAVLESANKCFGGGFDDQECFEILLIACGLVLLTATIGSAQDSIPFVPSPMYVVHKMIEVAEIKKGDILYDMGSGDGRIVIEAAKKYGISGVGIDLNPELVAKARENALKEGVSHLVEFRAQDGLTVDISEATVVTLYMFKWFNNATAAEAAKAETRFARGRP